MCDYATISIARGGSKGPLSAGLLQYYTNPKALDKLLKSCSTTRTMEMGKLAAFEYEAVTKDGEDYLCSVKRNYQRTSIISNLRPMSLFLKIDLHAAGVL